MVDDHKVWESYFWNENVIFRIGNGSEIIVFKKKRCENELSLPSFKFCRNKAVTITIIYKLQLR